MLRVLFKWEFDGPVNKRSQQTLIFTNFKNLQLKKITSFVWVTGWHQLSLRLNGAWELRELSCKLSLLNSHQLSSSFDQRMRVERTLVQTLASQLSSTLILVWPAHESWENSCANSRFSTLIYSHPRLTGAWELRELLCKLSLLNSHLLSSSFDQRMRVETTLVQTLASQLSSTLILVWPAHESWENSRANSRFSTLIYSHPRLTGAWELRELLCKLSLLNSHLLSSSFDWRMRVERTLVQTLASQLSSTLILVWPAHESWENSRANSRFSTLIYSHLLSSTLILVWPAHESWEG